MWFLMAVVSDNLLQVEMNSHTFKQCFHEGLQEFKGKILLFLCVKISELNDFTYKIMPVKSNILLQISVLPIQF